MRKKAIHRLIDLAIDTYVYALVIFAILVLMFYISGCTSLPDVKKANTEPKYQLNLAGSVDGNPFSGTHVGSKTRHHDMITTSAIPVNYFTVQTCHKSLQYPDWIERGWFEKRQKEWSYDEDPGIEDSGDCILRVCGFSNTVGSPPVDCAVIDFQSDRYALPFTNLCNGNHDPARGTAICHTQVGLIERVQFAGPVATAPKETDPAGKNAPTLIRGQCEGRFLDANSTLWEYVMPADECTIKFMEKVPPYRRGKLTVIPYDLPRYKPRGD